MLVRLGHITNSSSSNYVVAIKGGLEVPDTLDNFKDKISSYPAALQKLLLNTFQDFLNLSSSLHRKTYTFWGTGQEGFDNYIKNKEGRDDLDIVYAYHRHLKSIRNRITDSHYIYEFLYERGRLYDIDDDMVVIEETML